MGMGDIKHPFEPNLYKVRDEVIGKSFPTVSVRPCPHPNVIKRYGIGGVANVAIWTCKRCKFATYCKFGELVGCSYGLELHTAEEG